jgi:hypothetical protein
MYGEGDLLLYVGKAKDLRARLMTYRRARPDRESRKVLRLVRLIRRIEWEICETETAALLHENSLLRSLRPPMNVMNTRPESYVFVAFRHDEGGSKFGFRLSWNAEPDGGLRRGEQLYGAFKGGGIVHRGLLAVMRLLWAAQWQAGPRFEYPIGFTGRRVPRDVSFAFAPTDSPLSTAAWASAVRRFLNGTSVAFLRTVAEHLVERRQDLPKFYDGWIQQDLEEALYFYEVGPRRNKQLRKIEPGLSQGPIAQDRRDDLVVLWRAAEGDE